MMNNNIEKQKFDKLSFWQLIKRCSIEIPIIQRDYAQGRPQKEKIRNVFLDALKGALLGNPIELDFVYGSEQNNILKPLDGQQRLTTLFLLHWFVATKETKLNEAKEYLSKFTYETRISSREFCEKLVDISIDYEELLPMNEREKITPQNQLSETIKNASWFMIPWKNDPTIQAMLIMLDAIHLKFKNESNLWEKLIDEQNPPITFLYTKLENFGLSDDLYIKMNARGKELTPFENFKSRFENHIEKKGWENDLQINEYDTEDEKKEKYIKQFRYKIDREWTDLFWKYRTEINIIKEDGSSITEYEIDSRLTNFITSIAINNYAISSVYSEKDIIEQKIKILSDTPSELGIEDFPTEDSFNLLIDFFEKYAEIDDAKVFYNAELNPNICLWNNGFENTSLFKGIITGENVTMQKRVLFFAQTMFLLNKLFDKDEFNDWMRVIRNMVENTAGNWNLERMISAMKFVVNLMNEYKQYPKGVYSLLNETTETYSFNATQLKEEKRKAKIIVENPNYKELIFNVEDTDFCKGSINWCLDCVDTDNNIGLLELENIKSIIVEHLGKSDISNLFRRALLTIGNNEFYKYWGSWSYGTNTHKRCLIESRNNLKWYFTKGEYFENYFKPLVIQLITKDIQRIIDDYECPEDMPNWKKRLIKEPSLLDKYCEGHYFGITDDNQCYLYYKKKRPASKNDCKLIK
ncbi:hypothetical protein M2138_002070 [Dysgonomonadaceae bacterium PH5-43]|nr:hypothetical protein [Dysgonomonadaceae bacterium PH5-43]